MENGKSCQFVPGKEEDQRIAQNYCHQAIFQLRSWTLGEFMPIKQMFPPLKKKLDDALRDTGETGEIGETGTGIRGPRKPKKTTKSNRPQGC